MNAVEMMPPHLVGERLRQAREGANVLRQWRLTRLALREQPSLPSSRVNERSGWARFRNCAAIQTTVNALLRQESVHVDLVPRFRKLPGKGAAAGHGGRTDGIIGEGRS